MDDEALRWRRWLARHGASLVLFARQWTASPADAEDAMQNGFLNFWKNRVKARDEVAYLYACVRTAAMDLTRAGRRRDHRELHAQPLIPSAFEPAIERLERQASIEAAIQRLAGDQREVVVMKIWGGLTFSQIAEALDIPPNTAASRYRYAIARLETLLAAEVTCD